MANFTPPFAENGERRFPDATERDLGFLCGAAARALFNGLLHRLEAEVGEVISHAGLVGDDGDLTQLRQSIQAMIDASTGGGDPDQFLLVSQARARLPIYPDVLAAAGHFGVITPATGQVRIPAAVTFQHRGIFPITTVQTDFATDPSKTYHLRWNPTDGFQLKDLASGGYNPGTLAESDVSFDSTYDDMLVARVITNSSNAVTITNLINKDRYLLEVKKTTMETGPNWGVLPGLTAQINLARKPKLSLTNLSVEATVSSEGLASTSLTATRYTVNGFAAGYISSTPAPTNAYISGTMTVEVSL